MAQGRLIEAGLTFGAAAHSRSKRAGMMHGQQKNVILVVVDTLRRDCIGWHGPSGFLQTYSVQNLLQTPNLDALWEQSAVFTQVDATSPLTPQSHATLFTGRYPFHHGLRYFYDKGYCQETPTIWSIFKDNGYGTLAYETFSLMRLGGQLVGCDSVYGDELDAGGSLHQRTSAGLAALDLACERAVSLARGGVPFLLFVHFWDVHSPYKLVDHLWNEEGGFIDSARRNLALVGRNDLAPLLDKDALLPAEIDRLDTVLRRTPVEALVRDYVEGVSSFDSGRWRHFWDMLEAGGLLDSSVLVVTSDHGEDVVTLESGRRFTHGSAITEGMLNVPLCFYDRHGDSFHKHVVSHEPASLVDVLPTLCSALELSVGCHESFDGMSLFDRDGQPRRGSAQYAECTRSAGISADRRHLAADASWDDRVFLFRSLKQGGYKLVVRGDFLPRADSLTVVSDGMAKLAATYIGMRPSDALPKRYLKLMGRGAPRLLLRALIAAYQVVSCKDDPFVSLEQAILSGEVEAQRVHDFLRQQQTNLHGRSLFDLAADPLEKCNILISDPWGSALPAQALGSAMASLAVGVTARSSDRLRRGEVEAGTLDQLKALGYM